MGELGPLGTHLRGRGPPRKYRTIAHYSPKCVEGVFSEVELRLRRILGSSYSPGPVRGSKKFSCENRGKANKRRPMTLVRVEETDAGGFTVLNLQMVARLKCAGFDGRQQEHRASVFFSDGGMVELAGTDADRV